MGAAFAPRATSIVAVTAAIALAVVLVVAVAGMSLAMQTQRPVTQGRPVRQPRPSTPPRRPSRGERRTPSPAPPTPETSAKIEEPKRPELLRTGRAASAKVIAVVDERTTGSLVRSRLTLKVEPDSGEPFEVQVRHAFPSLEARSEVKVGGTVAVRYDPDDHARVVLVPGE